MKRRRRKSFNFPNNVRGTKVNFTHTCYCWGKDWGIPPDEDKVREFPKEVIFMFKNTSKREEGQ